VSSNLCNYIHFGVGDIKRHTRAAYDCLVVGMQVKSVGAALQWMA